MYRFGELEESARDLPRLLPSAFGRSSMRASWPGGDQNEIPPRVEYQPTGKTEELGELFRALERWSARNTLHPVPMVSVVGRLPA